ncbi:MAG: hypothetical protein P4L40_03935 [Terracidiphilus sp.]|nr:hypothetical protein [Terracidiphilus sp.]
MCVCRGRAERGLCVPDLLCVSCADPDPCVTALASVCVSVCVCVWPLPQRCGDRR